MNNPLYSLVKIDVTDTYVLADIFDDGKYTVLAKSDDIESLLQKAIDGYHQENPTIKSYQ